MVCFLVVTTDAVSICTMAYLTDCMRPFQAYFDEGVSVLQSADNTSAALICRCVGLVTAVSIV
jgi:hypothetical protein